MAEFVKVGKDFRDRLDENIYKLSTELAGLQDLLFSVSYISSQQVDGKVQIMLPLNADYHFQDLHEAFTTFLGFLASFSKDEKTREHEFFHQEGCIHFITGEIFGKDGLADVVSTVRKGDDSVVLAAFISNREQTFVSVTRLIVGHVISKPNFADGGYCGVLN